MIRFLPLGLVFGLTFTALAQDAPVVQIVLPESNATYGKLVPVQIDLQNFRLTNRWSIPGSTEQLAVPNEGHLRYTLDNQPLASTTATTLMLVDLPTAEHTLVVSLVHSDHTPTGFEQRVIFNVLAPRKGLTKRPVVGQVFVGDTPAQTD